VNRIEDVLTDEHIVAEGYLATLSDGDHAIVAE
jgi:hypothetical protein